MTLEIMRLAALQEPGPDKLRRTRWVIVRNSYPELRDTTLKTWLKWVNEDRFGDFNYSRMVHNIRFNDIHMEVLFRALDRPSDVRKVLSLEVTGAWFNEAREIPFGIIEGMDDAIGRYPAVVDGGCRWAGIMMDTNSPDEDHWWHERAEEETPHGWEFFSQPGALIKDKEGSWIANPFAENIEYCRGGIDWYLSRVHGKSEEHIACYYGNQYVFVKEGKPVHPDYNDTFHGAKEILAPIPGRDIFIGLDFGRTPAAVFGQRIAEGRWIIFDELVTQDMGAERFANEVLGPQLRGKYKGFDFEIYGDPAGDDRGQTDENTPFDMLAAANIEAEPAPSNDLVLRIGSVDSCLNRAPGGRPGLLISRNCKTLRKALSGGYYYKRLQVSGENLYRNKPYKNNYSHIAEALQYMLLGAGEGDALVQSKQRTLPAHEGGLHRGSVEQEHAWMLG
jgi:hypothetical protein